ncbi:MAG: two-component system sensor histidine kinase AlgZ [Arenicella sp.]
MKSIVIPQLCRNSNLLILVLLTQIVVSVVWLCFDAKLSVYALGTWSLFAQWSALSSAFLLCVLRRQIQQVPPILAMIMVVVIICVSVMFIDLVFVYLLRYDNGWVPSSARLIRVVGAALLISVLTLRFFALLDVLDKRSKAEAESRILALQSRIQPHFLFNCLNTIAELTVLSPAKAEKAIGSLSMLFRAGLENQRNRHSMERELVLAKRYIELEKWRLGKRLTIEWQIGIDDTQGWEVPKLIVQPLLENAIVHGMQLDGTIHITVDIRETRNHLSFRFENAKGGNDSPSNGHGIALDNIRERLLVLYDDQHTFQVKNSDDLFVVLMRIPKQRYISGAVK